jgi:surface polysaccharide O-acyltransferase-like enzyme
MRNYTLDGLRILACLMVVTMHAPLPGSESDGLFLSTLSYLTAPGIGLFFMISGALLLPVKTDTRTFLRRRFSKIAIPAFVWSVLFLGITALTTNESFSWKALFSIPFSAQGNPTFWFLYTLMGLYLLAPVLSHWLNTASRRELDFYLLLWGGEPLLSAFAACPRHKLLNDGHLVLFLRLCGLFRPGPLYENISGPDPV